MGQKRGDIVIKVPAEAPGTGGVEGNCAFIIISKFIDFGYQNEKQAKNRRERLSDLD